jgi:hypothetical protein
LEVRDLLCQPTQPLLEFMASSLVLGERDDGLPVGLGETLELLL